jgi:catechol 2,3-dioxygenase-like lactoylglutathione lyase family enzyme
VEVRVLGLVELFDGTLPSAAAAGGTDPGCHRFFVFRTGMDHVALGVPDRAALAAFEQRLDELGATYTPTAETPLGAVIVFRDPDGIEVEFFVTEPAS